MNSRLLALGAVILLCACQLESHQARVPIPGSSLVLVRWADEKQLTRYSFELNGQVVSEQTLLGPVQDLGPKPAQVTAQDHVVRVSWGEGLFTQFVEVDTTACAVTKHSNQLTAPPTIKRCQ